MQIAVQILNTKFHVRPSDRSRSVTRGRKTTSSKCFSNRFKQLSFSTQLRVEPVFTTGNLLNQAANHWSLRSNKHRTLKNNFYTRGRWGNIIGSSNLRTELLVTFNCVSCSSCLLQFTVTNFIKVCNSACLPHHVHHQTHQRPWNGRKIWLYELHYHFCSNSAIKFCEI
jgi:hypothetical protein